MKISHKLFSDENTFHKYFDAKATLAEVSGCGEYKKLENGKYKLIARFQKTERFWNGDKCLIESYRYAKTGYEFTVKTMYK